MATLMEPAQPEEVGNRILNLPAELRINIYHHVLSSGPVYIGKPTLKKPPKIFDPGQRRRPGPRDVPCVRRLTSVDLIHTISQRIRREILTEAFRHATFHVYYNDNIFRTNQSYEQYVAEVDGFALSKKVAEQARTVVLDLMHYGAPILNIADMNAFLNFLALFKSAELVTVISSISPHADSKFETLKARLATMTSPEQIQLRFTNGYRRCIFSRIGSATSERWEREDRSDRAIVHMIAP